MGDTGETSVNSCGPRHPEWEIKGRQVYKAPRVGNKGETRGTQRDKGDVSVNSCGPRHPEWETLMRPKAPEWETRGRQV